MLRCAFAFRRLGSRALPLRAQGQGCSGVPPPPQKVGNSLSSQDSVALFIDGENLSPAVLRPMLKVLEQSSGEILQSRVYIGKHQASFARAAELEGIEQISVPQNGASMKESGDLMLALDAAETCLSGSCKTIAIASEDLDFLILLRKGSASSSGRGRSCALLWGGEDPDGVDVDRSAKNPAGHEGAGDIC